MLLPKKQLMLRRPLQRKLLKSLKRPPKKQLIKLKLMPLRKPKKPKKD
jgi:hypothetical protein